MIIQRSEGTHGFAGKFPESLRLQLLGTGPAVGGVRTALPRAVRPAFRRQLREPLSYINLAGKQWTYPLWQLMFHLVNHGTYHRGQVTTLLRQLGAQATSVDYLLMFDLKAQASAR